MYASPLISTDLHPTPDDYRAGLGGPEVSQSGPTSATSFAAGDPHVSAPLGPRTLSEDVSKTLDLRISHPSTIFLSSFPSAKFEGRQAHFR